MNEYLCKINHRDPNTLNILRVFGAGFLKARSIKILIFLPRSLKTSVTTGTSKASHNQEFSKYFCIFFFWNRVIAILSCAELHWDYTMGWCPVHILYRKLTLYMQKVPVNSCGSPMACIHIRSLICEVRNREIILDRESNLYLEQLSNCCIFTRR